MKKLITLLMTTIMLLSLATTAWAANGDSTDDPVQITTAAELKSFLNNTTEVYGEITASFEYNTGLEALGVMNVTSEKDLDLNGQTITVPNDVTNMARPIALNSDDANLTIHGGTYQALGTATTGAFGAIEVKNTATEAVLDVYDMTFYNTRNTAMCIKAYYSDNITIKDSTFNCSNGAGAIDTAGNTVIAKNVTVNQTGTNNHAATGVSASYCSLANVKDCNVLADGYALFVYNSGGTINVYSGDYQADIAVLKVDNSSAGSTINVYGGSFDGVISDTEDNIDCGINIYGGTFENTALDVDAFKAYVVEGATVTYTGTTTADFVFTVTPPPVVATIGDAEYYTLQEAITAAEDGDTVKLLADVTEDITIAAEKEITLDLNGQKLTDTLDDSTGTRDGQHTINNHGILTIIDSSSEKTGIVDNITNDQGALFNHTGATVVIKGGKFTRSLEVGNPDSGQAPNSWYVIANNGNMTIEDGVVVDGRNNYEHTPHSSLILNGSLKTDYAMAADDVAVLNINGGEFLGGTYVYSRIQVELNISGGSFVPDSDVCGFFAENTTITGGVFEQKVNCYFCGSADMNITGGTFKKSVGIYGDGATIAISGGFFNEQVPATYVAVGYVATTEAVDGYYTVDNKVADTVKDAVKDLTEDSSDDAIKGAAGTVAAIPNEDLLDHIDTVNKVDELLQATGDISTDAAITKLNDSDATTAASAVDGVEKEDLQVSEAAASKTEVKGLALAVVGKDLPASGDKVEVTLKINQTAATVSETDGKLAAAVTYDIKPEKTTKASGGSTTTADVENKDINAPITFKLHLPSIFDKTNRAAVEHAGTDLGKYTVYHDGTDNYIWITTTHFSEFVVSLADNVSYGSVKKYNNDLEVGKGGDAVVQPLSAAAGTTVWITPKADKGYKVDEVIVDGGDVKVTNAGDGTYSYVQPARVVDIEVTFEATEEVKEEIKEETKEEETIEALTKFVDVQAGAWYEEFVAAAVEKGIMQGNSATEFAPNDTTTRAMMITVLFNMSGKPATETAETAWYSEAQAWAMTTGVSDGSNITGELTREQLVTMLYRYSMSKGEDTSATANLTTYADNAKVADYAVDAFKWAVAKGIINGSNGNLNPQASATRAELAKIMVSYLD